MDLPIFFSPNPWDSSKEAFEETRITSSEIYGCNPIPASSTSEPELHLTVSAAKAAPNQTFFVSTKSSGKPGWVEKEESRCIPVVPIVGTIWLPGH